MRLFSDILYIIIVGKTIKFKKNYLLFIKFSTFMENGFFYFYFLFFLNKVVHHKNMQKKRKKKKKNTNQEVYKKIM